MTGLLVGAAAGFLGALGLDLQILGVVGQGGDDVLDVVGLGGRVRDDFIQG